MSSKIFDEALKGVKSTVTGIAKTKISSVVADTLGKYRIGGVSLGTLLPIGEMEDLKNDILNEMQFRVLMSLEKDFPQALIKEVNIGTSSLKYTTAKVAGRDKYFANGIEYSGLSVTCFEDTAGTLRKTWESISGRVYSDGFYGIPADFKQTITVFLIDHEGKPFYTIEHQGCSPISMSNYRMTTDGQKIITATMTFHVENIVCKDAFGNLLSGKGIKDLLIRGVKDSLVGLARKKVNDYIRTFPR